MAKTNVFSERHQRTRALVTTALLAALIAVIQIVFSILPISVSGFSLSFVLIPIVVGAVLVSPLSGAILGFVFSIVVVITCVIGIGGLGSIMFQVAPFATVGLCLLKGTLAGLCAGLVYKLLSGLLGKTTVGQTKSVYFSSIAASLICPVVNTGIFCIGAFTVFRSLMESTAVENGMTIMSLFYTIILFNFIPELIINVVICPILIATLHSTSLFKR